MSMIESARSVTVPCPFCDTLNRVDLDRIDDRPKCGSCGRPILMDRPLKVGDQNLERVVADAKVPVLVDFYADWCAPCKMMAPILDEVAHDRAGSLLVTKLDTDRNPTMAVRYSIRGIPTLILFHEGREVGRQTGAVPRAQLESWIDAAVGAGEA
ncbi:MAG: thioredoxin TrxC [Gemmatimonadota bacterium]|jgi:thioredoxin 2